MNEFKNFLKFFLADFAPYSNDYLSRRIKKSAQYPELIGDFYENLRDFSQGGKALRPFLVYLGYLVGRTESSFQRLNLDKRFNLNEILPICLAVELIHACFLIQDDIIDRSDIRRGKPTIHKRYEKRFGYHYGISQAIMASDIACFEVFDLLSKSDFGESTKKLAFERFIKTLLETVYGEALDIEHSYVNGNFEQIRQVTDLKTARYSFIGPLTIGAILGGAVKARIDAMGNYGLLVGTAFQLQDDLLGVFGNEEVLGKSVLSDLREGKNTILIYKTKEMVTGKVAKALGQIWGNKNAQVADLVRARRIIKASGALDWSYQEQLRLIDQAKRVVKSITPEPKLRSIFGELADFVISREK